jgi:dihydrofolate synthase/folylpolyglutamate synthase
MDYPQALEYLASLNKFGINLGLARIKKLLALMQHPERRYHTIHITGTNGKGSTAAMLASICRAAGLKTGLYTSPHLESYTERIMINSVSVSEQQFAQAIAYTSKFVEQMVADGDDHPTEFEVLTAAAFYLFAAAGVEYAVIEVGLGGLLDSTNIITPVVSVITNVTLEHTDRCGNTIAEIAKHKAGIIKPGVPVVTAATDTALQVIETTANAKTAPLAVLGRDFTAMFAGFSGFSQQLNVSSRDYGELGLFTLPLLGRHQVENAAVAVIAALTLAKTEPRLTLAAIRRGVAETSWPGRFEVFPGKPVTVIDGAHNPDGAKVLRRALDDVFPDQPIHFVFGTLRDKDLAGIVQNLIRRQDTVIVVSPASPRAATTSYIAGEILANHVETAESVREGIARAKQLAKAEGIVCVAGSLYLVGPARAVLVK